MNETAPLPKAPARRPRRKTATIALIVVAALGAAVVAVGVGSEFYLRTRVSDCLAQAVERSVGSDVDVTLSSKPMLLQQLDGATPWVEVSSAEPRFGGAEGMALTLRLTDVRTANGDSGPETTVGGSTATVTWTADGIARTIQQRGAGAAVTSVTANPASQSLDIAILGQLVGITAQPRIEGGTIEVEVTEASLLGGLIGIPTEIPQQVVGTLSDGLTEYPLGLEPKTLRVTDTALEVALEGGPTTLNGAEATRAAGANPQQQEPLTCSLF